MTFGFKLNYRYYGGSSVNSDVPARMQVALGGHGYIVDLEAGFSRISVDPLKPFSDGSADVGEALMNPQALWRRSAIDWSLGSQQSFFDDPQTSDRRRFSTSKGVDPWTPRQLQLHKDTALSLGSATTGGLLLAVGGYLYAAQGSTLKWTTDGTTWTDANIQAGTGHTLAVLAITTDGNAVFAAMGADGVHKTVLGASSSTVFSTAVTTTALAYANGRLIAGSNNSIYEILAGGTATLVFTHATTTFVWKGFAAAPMGTYAFGSNSDRTETYIIGVVDATGQLAAPVWSGAPPNGETINDLYFYGGTVLAATSRGLRLCSLTGMGGLVFGPAVLVAGGCNAIAAEGRFAWSTWTNFDSVSTGLVRADLARFVFPMVPATASDLMATTQGKVTAVAYFGTSVYFAIDGIGVYGQHATNYVASGTVNSGFIRFGVVDPKLISLFDMRHDAMPVGASIVASLLLEDGTASAIGTSSAVNTFGPSQPLSAGNLSSEAPQVVVVLNRATDPTKTPVLRRWLLKGLPTPTLVDTIVLPIVMAESVDTINAEGEAIAYVPRDEWSFLRGLVSTRTVVAMQVGNQTESVYVYSLELKPTRGWTVDKSIPEGLYIATVRTLG